MLNFPQHSDHALSLSSISAINFYSVYQISHWLFALFLKCSSCNAQYPSLCSPTVASIFIYIKFTSLTYSGIGLFRYLLSWCFDLSLLSISIIPRSFIWAIKVLSCFRWFLPTVNELSPEDSLPCHEVNSFFAIRPWSGQPSICCLQIFIYSFHHILLLQSLVLQFQFQDIYFWLALSAKLSWINPTIPT